MKTENEQTSDWKPVKTEDIVRLYRAGWTLKNNECPFIHYTLKNIPNKANGLLETCFLSDTWVGKPPEKQWKVVFYGMTFLAAMRWLGSGLDGRRRIRLRDDRDAIVACNGAPHWVNAETGKAGAFVICGTSLTSATDFEGLEEVAE